MWDRVLQKDLIKFCDSTPLQPLTENFLRDSRPVFGILIDSILLISPVLSCWRTVFPSLMKDAEIYQKQGAVEKPGSICVLLDAGCPLSQNQLLILLQKFLSLFAVKVAYVATQSWADELFPIAKMEIAL